MLQVGAGEVDKSWRQSALVRAHDVYDRLVVAHRSRPHTTPHGTLDETTGQCRLYLPWGPWHLPAERGPSLESIYRVSFTVDLCEAEYTVH